MIEKIHETEHGNIHYWVDIKNDDVTLVFLPGLTADHRLFSSQCEFFTAKYNVLVWDCPCHGKSRPYDVFTYADVTSQLHAILEMEKIENVILIGQSLGGMIAQFYIDRYPDKVKGFISVDSVPFGDYYSRSDLFWLQQLEWMCRLFPDSMLRKSMAKMCGATKTAQDRMLEMLSSYSKRELCHLMYIGEAAFIPENKNVDIPCRSLLILGDKDKVGKVAAYNREWARRTGFPLNIVRGAAHNANDDRPEEVNRIIEEYIISSRSRCCSRNRSNCIS